MELKVRLCSLAVGYLLGGILTAEIAAKVFAKKPIGKIGTGNPGMPNSRSHGTCLAAFRGRAADNGLVCGNRGHSDAEPPLPGAGADRRRH